MPTEERIEAGQGWPVGSCLLWFFWGVSLSFMTIFSLVLLALLAASLSLNAYLTWQVSGFEVSISRPGPGAIEAPLPIPTDVLAAIPTNTPEPTPTGTPTPGPTEPSVETQYATLAAIATEAAASQTNSTPGPIATATPLPPPTTAPAPVAINTPASATDSSEAESDDNTTTASTESPPAATPVAQAEPAQDFSPPATSSNSYALIPLEGERDPRPAEEHGDLNLKLRDPQPINVDLSLVDIADSGIDPHAPRFSEVFKPNFVAAYTIHDWDWNCNCKGKLLNEDHLVLAGIKTTPGEPIFIPPTDQDIYQGKYYATVLFASEDSLTFLYARTGTVARGYAMHLLGLRTDPNLLKLYRESTGNQLPGLTLDTPVGTATNELIVAIRDNGKFLDVRSTRDWWD